MKLPPAGPISRSQANYADVISKRSVTPPLFQFFAANRLITARIKLQAALKPFVNNSIFKTINILQNTPLEEFKLTYDSAYDISLTK